MYTSTGLQFAPTQIIFIPVNLGYIIYSTVNLGYIIYSTELQFAPPPIIFILLEPCVVGLVPVEHSLLPSYISGDMHRLSIRTAQLREELACCHYKAHVVLSRGIRERVAARLCWPYVSDCVEQDMLVNILRVARHHVLTE